MEHNVSLISTIAAGFGLALILGLAAERLKIPALVGYLLAGIIICPRALIGGCRDSKALSVIGPQVSSRNAIQDGFSGRANS
jgi:predicted Kef-type K+ transport protein